MSNCACVYVEQDGDYPSFYLSKTVTAKKPHKCSECRRAIMPGEQYERVTGKWDGYLDTFKTCSDCLSIREEMFCDGWSHGGQQEYLQEHINNVDGIDEDCLCRLTPNARAYVCNMLEDKWGDFDYEG